MKRVRLSDEIADRLVDSIISGKFRFGERLPAERELAKYLNVGRPTMREALRTLSVVGLVKVKHGEGTFVVDNHSDFVARAFRWGMLLDAQATREIVEARTAIESELAKLAARRAHARHIVRMNSALEQMRAARGSTDRFCAADVRFHLAIADAADNEALRRMLTAIESLLRRWIRHAVAQPGAYDAALDHHAQILSAVERRDEQAAQEAMRTHLEEMGQLIGDTWNELGRGDRASQIRPLKTGLGKSRATPRAPAR